MEEFAPTHLINCSAYNAVDRAEDERELSMTVNGRAPGQMAELCSQRGCVMVHYGTDFVFDGRQTRPYSEEDIPSPLSWYGKTKLAGEESVLRAGPEHLVLRVSWVFGPGQVNFPRKALTWARGQGEMKVADDETSIPTWTGFIAQRTLKTLQAGLSGLFHAVPGGPPVTRYDYALEIMRLAGISRPVERVSRNSFNLPAPRPEFSALSGQALCRALDLEPEDWRIHLRDFFHFGQI